MSLTCDTQLASSTPPSPTVRRVSRWNGKLNISVLVEFQSGYQSITLFAKNCQFLSCSIIGINDFVGPRTIPIFLLSITNGHYFRKDIRIIGQLKYNSIFEFSFFACSSFGHVAIMNFFAMVSHAFFIFSWEFIEILIMKKGENWVTDCY